MLSYGLTQKKKIYKRFYNQDLYDLFIMNITPGRLREMTLKNKIQILQVMACNNLKDSNIMPYILEALEEDLFNRQGLVDVDKTGKIISYLSRLNELHIDVQYLLDKTKGYAIQHWVWIAMDLFKEG